MQMGPAVDAGFPVLQPLDVAPESVSAWPKFVKLSAYLWLVNLEAAKYG
jgi:hypothetical protein